MEESKSHSIQERLLTLCSEGNHAKIDELLT